MPYLTVGDYNLTIGTTSTSILDTGSNNLIVGNNSFIIATTGSDNIILGNNTGKSLTTSSGNIYLGNYIGNANVSNEIVIGHGTSTASLIGKGAGSCLINAKLYTN